MPTDDDLHQKSPLVDDNNSELPSRVDLVLCVSFAILSTTFCTHHAFEIVHLPTFCIFSILSISPSVDVD